MGEEIKRRTVIDIAVALRTVARGPAVLQGAVCVMTGRTGIVLHVVATIHKRLARGNGRGMAGRAVRNQRHVTGTGMIDGVITPDTARMAGATHRTTARTR